jgi:cellulose synthase/poly-beta-1,6-N-acetylglucosamine synthase-like glycosyltransferase
MTQAVVLLFTLYGLTFVFWAGVGCLRLVNERDGWAKLPARMLTGAGAGLLSALLFGIYLSVLRLGIEWLGLPVGSSAIVALLAALLLGLGCIAVAALGARLIADRSQTASIRLIYCVAHGTAYTLAFQPIYWDLAYAVFVSDVLTGLSVVLLHVLAIGGAAFGTRQRMFAHVTLPVPGRGPVRADEVAVLIAAHNEEACIAKTLQSALRIVPAEQIFVGSDGSSDRTVEIVRAHGCQVLDFQPNRGKAGALKGAIEHFELCSRFKAVLILDADSELDPRYLEDGLPLLDDPTVSAIAGHAVTKWHPHRRPRWSMLFSAYRVRLYRLLQAMLRYGQTWKQTNVSYIIPGAGSIYRTDILQQIDITAPGLIIEDFNMTFELHHKRLGRIAYSPNVRFTCEDPISLRDYWSQVRRWSLGFWQTVLSQGVWPSGFWLALAPFILELFVISVFFTVVPLLVVVSGLQLLGWDFPTPQVLGMPLDLWDLFLALVVADYALTLLITAIERKPIMLIYGGAFLLLRWIDALLFLWTLPQAFLEKSNGMWSSPKRPEAA